MNDDRDFGACITACMECADACNQCFAACLNDNGAVIAA